MSYVQGPGAPLDGDPSHAPRLPPALKNEVLYALTNAVLDTLVLSGDPQPYSLVAPIVGYHHRSRAFFAQLGRTLQDDHAAGKPFRASLVVNKTTGLPGPAYFEVLKSLGYDISNPEEFWLDQLQKLLLPAMADPSNI